MAHSLVQMGDFCLKSLFELFDDEAKDYRLSFKIVRVLDKIGGPKVDSFLVKKMYVDNPQLRYLILKSLSKIKFAIIPKNRIQSLIKLEIEKINTLNTALMKKQFPDLQRALFKDLELTFKRLLLCFEFFYQNDAFKNVLLNMAAKSKEIKAYAFEVLDTVLEAQYKDQILEIFKYQLFPKQRKKLIGKNLEKNLIEVLNFKVKPGSWTYAISFYLAGKEKTNALKSSQAKNYKFREKYVEEAKEWALSQIENKGKKESDMLLTVEKVMLLRSLEIFSETSEQILSEISEVVEELQLVKGDKIIEEGELSTSLYVVVNGKVEVCREGKRVAMLGRKAIFGELAFLDPSPRNASVIAIEDSLVFRLNQADFFSLLEDRVDITKGILKYLVRELREHQVKA